MTSPYCWICQSPAAVHVQGSSYVCADHAQGTGGHEPDADTRIFDPWDVAEMLRYRANKADEERTRLEGDE